MDSTNQPEQPKECIRIEFEVMGLGREESDFLNWAMSQYDNLQFMRNCRTLEKTSTQTIIHHDQFCSIEIDDVIKHKKF
jgi:hypothetical protein